MQLYGKQWHAEKLRPGCRAEIAARLRPLPLPIVIDGHDPRLRSWFAGQRGRGFIKSINATNCDGSTGWAHRLANWRLDLAAHYRATMSAESGAVAAALVTGVRGMISPDTRRAFRHSGLAHMLAISGLHMALFAGSVYALIRLLAALWPALVLRRDMRKPAALVALLAATGYLVISGAGIATQRAYIMLAIFFLAVLLDRPAITMRNVLWAALIVLLIQPHAIMQVGFQMSFAAVMALVAVYEAWRRNDRLYMRLEDLSPWLRAARIGWRYVSALTVTSLIAGGVTGFIALTQFYQIGNYGLPANLLAMPIFGTLIMPMAPLSLVLLPTGFDWLALSIMQTGIETVLALAAWVTAFDGALWRAGASPDWVLPVAATGFVWLCLVNARWRFLGVLPIALATLYLGSGNRPVAHLVGRDAIVVQEEGRGLKLMRSNGRSYELGVMARYPCKALLLDEPKLQRGVPLQIVSDGRHLSIKRARRARLWQRARRTTE